MPVDLTTELRWFFEGALPDDALSWFTHDGATGFVETRRDHYRLDDQVDIGVKRRHGTILELKLRQGRPARHLQGELDGQRETWKRWSPADGLIDLDERTTWVDVDKAIIKRRVGSDGHEVQLTQQTRAMTGQGCDAEIAGVSVRGRSTWTFALAAFGSAHDHRSALAQAWDRLVREHSAPRRLRLERANSCGYPEWMARRFHDDAASSGQRSRASSPLSCRQQRVGEEGLDPPTSSL